MHKELDRNTTRRTRVSGVQFGVPKMKGLYTGVTVAIYERCSTLRLMYQNIHIHLLVKLQKTNLSWTHPWLDQSLFYSLFTYIAPTVNAFICKI